MFYSHNNFWCNCPLDLDLDLRPCDLDLWSTSTSHLYQSYVWMSSRSNHPFMICRPKHSMLTNTHIRTQVFIESSFGFTGQDYCLILIICISIINIQSPVHDLWPKQFFGRIAYLTLTFDLDLWSTSTSHLYQSCVWMSSRSNLPFMIYRPKTLDADRHTYIHTHTHRDTSGYRVALQFYWTRLKTPTK